LSISLNRQKKNFDSGKYRSAEKLYQEILTKTPNNLYSLSNLGVLYFRTGKLKAAELTLKKAVAIAPKDEFATPPSGSFIIGNRSWIGPEPRAHRATISER
jgi:predicted Zn-dependent protease